MNTQQTAGKTAFRMSYKGCFPNRYSDQFMKAAMTSHVKNQWPNRKVKCVEVLRVKKQFLKEERNIDEQVMIYEIK